MTKRSRRNRPEMTWEYRVVRIVDGTAERFEFREVYREDDALLGFTASADSPMGASLTELADDLGFMQRALSLPVLDEADLQAQFAARGRTLADEAGSSSKPIDPVDGPTPQSQFPFRKSP